MGKKIEVTLWDKRRLCIGGECHELELTGYQHNELITLFTDNNCEFVRGHNAVRCYIHKDKVPGLRMRFIGVECPVCKKWSHYIVPEKGHCVECEAEAVGQALEEAWGKKATGEHLNNRMKNVEVNIQHSTGEFSIFKL